MGKEKVKYLGIHIGNRLNFDYHISQLCKKAGKKLHALTRVYPNQHQLTYKELLEKSKTVGIDHRNLQTLAIKIYKAKNKISPEFLNSLFEFTNKNYNLRNVSKRNRYFTVHDGSESLASLALKIWELVPDLIREVKTLSIFKNKI